MAAHVAVFSMLADEHSRNGILALVITFGLVAAIVVPILYFESKRRKKVEAAAKALGFTYRRKATPEDKTLLAGTQLATHGHAYSRTMCNLIEAARSDDLSITLLDYSYTTGAGRSSHTTQETVMRMQSPMLNLPEFVLYPESVLSKIAKAFGYADINFPEHPQFSKMFMLRGGDEAAIRQLFTRDVIELCEQHRGISLEAIGDRLLFFRAEKRIKAEQLEQFLADGKQILALFFQANRQSDAAAGA
jgi:hypothetical protein